MSVKNKVVSSIKKAFKIKSTDLYDYSTDENAQATALFLYNFAKANRTTQESLWEKYQDYYEGEHHVSLEVAAYLESQGIPLDL